jgi:hypothetical protein
MREEECDTEHEEPAHFSRPHCGHDRASAILHNSRSATPSRPNGGQDSIVASKDSAERLRAQRVAWQNREPVPWRAELLRATDKRSHMVASSEGLVDEFPSNPARRADDK